MMKYICYLSFSKVEGLYSQMSDFQPDKMLRRKASETDAQAEVGAPSIFGLLKAGLKFGARRSREDVIEGEINPVQKLKAVSDYLTKKHMVADLNECIDLKRNPDDALCYSYNGEFRCVQPRNFENQEFFQTEELDGGYVHRHNGLSTRSRITTLVSEYKGYRLILAASFRYFSDMGGSRIKAGPEYSDQDEWGIGPHSGNHHFFSGEHPATFETILFVSGQKDKDLYCSPLVIVNSYTPSFNI